MGQGINNIDKKEQFLSAYDQYANPIYRHAALRVGDKEQAIEIVHTVFARTWNYISKGKEIDNIKAFLFTIANNLIVDEYRKPKNVHFSSLEEDENFDIEDESENAPDVGNKAEIKIMVQAISKLSHTYREVITMRHLDGLLPQEISQITGLSENVISVRINRGVEKLKEILKITNG